MKKREALLLENEVLLAAVSIDPRKRILLSKDQIAEAKAVLCDVAVQMTGELPEESENSKLQTDEVTTRSSFSSTDEDSDFEKYVDNIEWSRAKRCHVNEHKQPFDVKPMNFKQDFLDGLKEVEKYDRSSKLIIKEVIAAYPEIVQFSAMIVTAMPSAQVGMERLLSTENYCPL